MTKNKRTKRLRERVCQEILNDIEDNSDDEDYNDALDDDVDEDNEEYNNNSDEDFDVKKRKASIDFEEDPIEKAMQKCHQIAINIRDALIASTLATKDSMQNGEKNEILVLKEDINTSCDIPESDATREIKPYQISGINFLLLLHRLKVGGAILADEMGLGKTIQVIAFLGVLKNIDENLGPHLIVAPVSLLENWKQEFLRWCPSFNVIVYRGNEKEKLCEEFLSLNEEQEAPPFDILITSYSIFERRSEKMKKDRKFLKRWKWNRVIMDEGHVLKDATSQRNKRLQDIVSKARQRIMLTGTPIQNNLQELWSLLSFLMPNTFNAHGKDLQEIFGIRNCNIQDQSLITKMQLLLKPFIIRRTKSEVLWQLQPKSQIVLKLDMIDAHAQAFNDAFMSWKTYAKSKNPNEKNNALVVNSLTHKEITNIFTHMRKISNHPLLVRRIYTDEVVEKLAKRFYTIGVFGKQCNQKQVYECLLYNTSDFDLHKLCEKYGGIFNGQGKLDNQLAFSSTKCQELAKLLPKLQKEGHRCLIFSQWKIILNILEWILNTLGYKFIRLDGETNVEERQILVNKFNNNQDIFIFLISTRAGGQGLNLIGADTVIIHDVDYNPQLDRQAEDRCHRIGQLKPVTVYRLVTKNSIDESIYNIAENKLTLNATILQTKHDPSQIDLQTMKQIILEHCNQ